MHIRNPIGVFSTWSPACGACLGLLLWGAYFGLLMGGCAPSASSNPDDPQQVLPDDYDGLWRITSETGLVNRCVTILGDRVTQVGECESIATWITETQPSARSDDQIIWTFETSETGGTVTHTISVRVQSDDTLSGTYSLRQADERFPLVDRIIMTHYVVRY